MAEQNQNQQFRCTGDCLNCRAINDRRNQWQYCAAQFSYNAFRTMQAMQESIKTMSGTISELKEKITAIQDSEATVFDSKGGDNLPPSPETPISPAPQPTAQEGDGALKDTPK